MKLETWARLCTFAATRVGGDQGWAAVLYTSQAMTNIILHKERGEELFCANQMILKEFRRIIRTAKYNGQILSRPVS